MRAYPLRPVALRRLVAMLPPRSLISLGAAIFTLFSSMGFLTDVMAGGTHPRALVAANVLFSGTIALVYAYSAMWNWKIFPIALALHLAYSALVRNVFGTPPAPVDPVASRLMFDAAGIIVCMACSYTFFLIFISTTGTRYLSAHAEILLAHEIHRVLVPPISRRIGEYEFYGLSEASGDVGGDLVDVLPLRANETTWIGYVADVSGHGVSSGVLMGMAKSAAHMKLREGAPIATLLDELNAVLYRLKRPSMYITFACVSDDGGDGLEFAVAGHLPIIHITAAGAMHERTTPQIPVAVFETYRFTSARLTCAPGDLLAVVTDGLTEVFDRADQEFGLPRLEEYLREHRNEPLPVIAQRLLETVRAHGDQIDDQTLLLIRRDLTPA